jgi:dolichyl-phosphate beta-glucosyltransferase
MVSAGDGRRRPGTWSFCEVKMTRERRPQPFLSIIIPAFNEVRRLPKALKQIREYVERAALQVEVIVVDDGSSDGTAKAAERFDHGPMPLTVLRNRINRGKGYSVRRGMRRAKGELLLMTDADQSTPIWEIEKALPYVGLGFDVVIGSRDMRESEVTHQPPLRWLMGKLLRFFRGRLMLADISDTQCGFKCFTRRAGKSIFSRQRIDGFAFDCEVLLIARRMGYRIKEIGVIWCDDRDSRVKPVRDSISMLVSLVKIRWRFRGSRTGAAPEGVVGDESAG